MDDNWLVALALSTSAIGIILMMAAMMLVRPDEASLHDVGAMADGEHARITGTIVGVRDIGDRLLLTLERPERITVVVGADVVLENGACVIVDGERSTYKGEAQLEATRVEVCATSSARPSGGRSSS